MELTHRSRLILRRRLDAQHSRQFVSWGKSLDQHGALYGEWWNKNFRLMHQQSYTTGGQVLYDGIWTPSTSAQFASWWKTREQLNAQYDEMWQQNMRLVNTVCRTS